MGPQDFLASRLASGGHPTGPKVTHRHRTVCIEFFKVGLHSSSTLRDSVGFASPGPREQQDVLVFLRTEFSIQPRGIADLLWRQS